MTLQRASLGHCSACKIWQIGTISLSIWRGDGVEPSAGSKNKTSSERRSRFSRDAQLCGALPVAFPGPAGDSSTNSSQRDREEGPLCSEPAGGGLCVCLNAARKSPAIFKNASSGANVSGFVDTQNPRSLGISLRALSWQFQPPSQLPSYGMRFYLQIRSL